MPVPDQGSFVTQHGSTVLVCLGLAAFCAAGVVFMLTNDAMMVLGGFLYLGVLLFGLLVSLLYPLQLYSAYRTIKAYEPVSGAGVIEVTARIEADQPDPVVVLRYRREGSSREISVPMSRKAGRIYATWVPKESILGGDTEGLMRCRVDVVDGGTARDICVVGG